MKRPIWYQKMAAEFFMFALVWFFVRPVFTNLFTNEYVAGVAAVAVAIGLEPTVQKLVELVARSSAQ